MVPNDDHPSLHAWDALARGERASVQRIGELSQNDNFAGMGEHFSLLPLSLPSSLLLSLPAGTIGTTGAGTSGTLTAVCSGEGSALASTIR